MRARVPGRAGGRSVTFPARFVWLARPARSKCLAPPQGAPFRRRVSVSAAAVAACVWFERARGRRALLRARARARARVPAPLQPAVAACIGSWRPPNPLARPPHTHGMIRARVGWKPAPSPPRAAPPLLRRGAAAGAAHARAFATCSWGGRRARVRRRAGGGEGAGSRPAASPLAHPSARPRRARLCLRACVCCKNPHLPTLRRGACLPGPAATRLGGLAGGLGAGARCRAWQGRFVCPVPPRAALPAATQPRLSHGPRARPPSRSVIYKGRRRPGLVGGSGGPGTAAAAAARKGRARGGGDTQHKGRSGWRPREQARPRAQGLLTYRGKGRFLGCWAPGLPRPYWQRRGARVRRPGHCLARARAPPPQQHWHSDARASAERPNQKRHGGADSLAAPQESLMHVAAEGGVGF